MTPLHLQIELRGQTLGELLAHLRAVTSHLSRGTVGVAQGDETSGYTVDALVADGALEYVAADGRVHPDVDALLRATGHTQVGPDAYRGPPGSPDVTLSGGDLAALLIEDGRASERLKGAGALLPMDAQRPRRLRLHNLLSGPEVIDVVFTPRMLTRYADLQAEVVTRGLASVTLREPLTLGEGDVPGSHGVDWDFPPADAPRVEGELEITPTSLYWRGGDEGARVMAELSHAAFTALRAEHRDP